MALVIGNKKDELVEELKQGANELMNKDVINAGGDKQYEEKVESDIILHERSVNISIKTKNKNLIKYLHEVIIQIDKYYPESIIDFRIEII